MSEWSALDQADAPLAARVGPFPQRGFVEVWWRHRGSGTPVVVGSGETVLPCVRLDKELHVAGESDLTDYHSPLGSDLDAIAVEMAEAAGGRRLVFDSLPEEVAHPLRVALDAVGIDATSSDHTATMVIDLPASVDEHYAALESKHRHEIRRKRRRFVDAVGEPGLHRDESAFDAFVEMHRAAPGEKGSFMTPPMESFFRDLLDTPGWALDVLVSAGKPVAAAFGYEEDDAYYLYNSAFDPALYEASPGIVLCDELIRSAIGSGRSRFDFLKGRESYKRRFGAVPRPLMRLEAVVP